MHESMKRLYEAARSLRGANTPAEAARLLGESQQTLKNWESRGISKSGLLRAQEVIGCRAEWLRGGSEPMAVPVTPKQAADQVLRPVLPWGDDTPLDDDEVELRFLKSWINRSGPGYAEDTIFDDGKRLRMGILSMRKAGVDPACCVVGINRGDSNAPLILDGAAVYVDLSKREIVEGEPYALYHDGEFRVKFLHKLPAGGLRLRSYNSSAYPDEDYPTGWHEHIQIEGWVWTWSPPIRKWRGR